MTTPWDRLTDDTYKSWLLEAMTVEEYNASTVRDRRGLLSDFEQQQQQQHTHVSSDEQSVTYSNNDNSTSMSADEDKKFDNKEELKDWLKTRGVDEDKVADAAEKLLARGFNRPSKLLGITVEELAEINKTMSDKEDKLSVALIRHLHNKLKEQQQQQPPAAPDTAVELQANSSNILRSWSQQMHGVPNISDLPKVVSTPLPMALPSPHLISVTDSPVDDVISAAVSTNIVPELGRLRDSIHALQRFGENEDSVHSLVDTLILLPIAMIGGVTNCPFSIGRNGVDRSGATVAKLRPDVLVWLPSGVLAFKGEDKATAHDIGLARDELISKLNFFSDAYFGRVPYQLCYAAGGNKLEFWAIQRPQARTGRATLSQLTTVVDLSTVQGRSLCVRYAVNISRILVSLQAHFPEGSVVKLGAQIESSLSVVNILGDYVVKKTRSFTEGDVLMKLYSQIQASHVPGLLTPRTWGISTRGLLTLHIGPVGFCGKRPESVDEAKIAGRRLLLALEWLHNNGWVHRDIRPENIMRADGDWYLNDLEWANTINSELGNYIPNEQHLPPELVGVEGVHWNAACDMWQFGKLIECWNQLDDSLLRYVTTQTQEEPQNRLSAEQSLSQGPFSLPVEHSLGILRTT